MTLFTNVLMISIGHLPLFTIWILGVALALRSWRKHPKVSLLTAIALLGFILLSFINTFFIVWLPIALPQKQLGFSFSVLGVVTSIVGAGLWGILLTAIFGWRSKRSLE
jgi:hypothetical protein